MKITYHDYISVEDALDYINTDGHIIANASWNNEWTYLINKGGTLVYVHECQREEVNPSFLLNQDNKFWFKGHLELEYPGETIEIPVMKFAELQGKINDLEWELNHLYHLLEERGVL